MRQHLDARAAIRRDAEPSSISTTAPAGGSDRILNAYLLVCDMAVILIQIVRLLGALGRWNTLVQAPPVCPRTQWPRALGRASERSDSRCRQLYLCSLPSPARAAFPAWETPEVNIVEGSIALTATLCARYLRARTATISLSQEDHASPLRH